MALSKAPGEITKIQWPVVSGQWPVASMGSSGQSRSGWGAVCWPLAT